MDSKIHALLSAFDEDSFARIPLNDLEVDLPAGTILTMAHCLHLMDGRARLYVETAHSEWMLDKLDAGAVFIDVGAATGAMTVPFALRYPNLEAYAFEPATRARRLLLKTLERNKIINVVVLNDAVSDTVGTATFVEQPVDLTGELPYLPETSSLSLMDAPASEAATSFDVKITTLDTLGQERAIAGRRVVVKIDIEGYEAFALRGATEFIRDNDVYFAIDIHASPEHEGMTGDDCRKALSEFGYSFAEEGHVLLCTPKV